MDSGATDEDRRGGGDRARTDAFRYAPGSATVWIFISIGVLGFVVILLVLFDAGGKARADAILAVPAGLFLILVTFGLLWVTRRAPVLFEVGPDGLSLAAAFAHPIPWRDIWRIRRTRRPVTLMQDLVMLKVELMQGVTPVYKRRLWTWPKVDAWIARNYGLRVPIHNLDAPEDVIIASVERFKPVQKVAT